MGELMQTARRQIVLLRLIDVCNDVSQLFLIRCDVQNAHRSSVNKPGAEKIRLIMQASFGTLFKVLLK